MMDWQDKIKAVAPTLGALLTTFGGPAGALAGAGLTAVANAIGSEPTEDGIAAVVNAGLSPEQHAALVAADLDYKRALLAADVRKVEIDADLTKATFADTQDARKTYGDNGDVLALGVVILGVWALLTGATLFGLYQLLIGGIKVQDVGVVATVFAVLGSTVGYVSNAAQQVVGFYFGSSRGSSQKTTVMADAIASVGRR